MALERRFASYTKEGDQEYSVQVNRIDDAFTCEVYGKFGNHEAIERKFEANGPEAEQQVQEWLYNLDEEVRALMENKPSVQLPESPAPQEQALTKNTAEPVRQEVSEQAA